MTLRIWEEEAPQSRKEGAMRWLLKGERIQEYSRRRPSLWAGGSCLLVGMAVGAEAMMYLFSAFGGAALVAGALFFYLGIRLLIFYGREGVWVTDQRVLYQKVTWRGSPGRLVEIPLREIRGVRLYKSCSMYVESCGGAVILRLKDQGQYVLPFLENGQYVMEAVFLGMKESAIT